MAIEPYLFFNGCCEEAIEFYKKALGAGVLMTLRYKDSPEPPPPGMVPAGWDTKIMHTCLRMVMRSHGVRRLQRGTAFSGIFPCVDGSQRSGGEPEISALAAGGQVQMPLGKTFWSPCFGMVTDRFGVGWMVTVAQ